MIKENKKKKNRAYDVLIANECLDDRLKLGRNGIMVKLDLEKAYDYVDWIFLDYMLGRMSLGATWRNWIYDCVISSAFSVLNGVLEGYFRSSRDLRQGDPLSPYLFIMVAEGLSRIIWKAENGYLSGFVVANSDVLILHLQYVDDLMIFCDVDV